MVWSIGNIISYYYLLFSRMYRYIHIFNLPPRLIVLTESTFSKLSKHLKCIIDLHIYEIMKSTHTHASHDNILILAHISQIVYSIFGLWNFRLYHTFFQFFFHISYLWYSNFVIPRTKLSFILFGNLIPYLRLYRSGFSPGQNNFFRRKLV